MNLSVRLLNLSPAVVLLQMLCCSNVTAAETVAAETAAARQAAIVRGRELSGYCSGCHGEAGIAPVPENPNLAGQNAEYLQYALKAYRAGARQGGKAGIMRPNAVGLSDQDIADLATFFSSLPGRPAQ